jgi:hypothetical protein
VQGGDGCLFALEAEEEGRWMAAEVGLDYFEAAPFDKLRVRGRMEMGGWRLETRDWRSFGGSLVGPFDGPFERLRASSG